MIAAVVALTLCAITAPAFCATRPLQWDTLHPPSPKEEGSIVQPSIRFGHTCSAFRGNLIVTHGYYYSRATNQATWLSDTWAMRLTSPYNWSQLSSHLPQQAALTSYNSGTAPRAPCGRFGHADAVYNDTLYMYGGHDGGFSRHGQQNYIPGHEFEELWAMELDTKRWRLLHASLPDDQPGPGKRYLAAAAAVDNRILLYGGLSQGQGDVWAYDLRHNAWSRLAPDAPREPGLHPGRRVGPSLTPIDPPDGKGPKGFVLFGGRHVDAGGATDLDPDAWFFDLTTATWRLLAVTSVASPPARMYHSEAHLHLPVARRSQEAVLVGVVSGGTITTPALTCTADTWLWVLNCEATHIRWHRLPDAPLSLYDGKAAAGNDAIFLFGGHLCDTNATGHAYPYTNAVHQLILKDHAAELTVNGCRVKIEAVEAALPHLAHRRHVDL